LSHQVAVKDFYFHQILVLGLIKGIKLMLCSLFFIMIVK
jgi:hypothetical protein